VKQVRELAKNRTGEECLEVESVSRQSCSSVSESVAVSQVMLHQAFFPYAGVGHTVQLPFYAATEINALK